MKMPILFVGHGSPMNAIQNNDFTVAWQEIGQIIKPKAILMISAHWFTHGTFTQDESEPRVINDMYGFPKALYEVNYLVKGDKHLTDRARALIKKKVAIDNGWGIDHGAWSVLNHMYPKRDVPVVQLSIDADAKPEDHYAIGKQLSPLRDEGIFIIGSGNIVHNLRILNWEMEGGYDWADYFDLEIKEAVLAHHHERCIRYKEMGKEAELSVPTTDHYDPLLYILGASREDDHIQVFNEKRFMGSGSMTSYLFE